MLTSVDIEIPDQQRAAMGVDARSTFRRMIQNRVRPRFQRAVGEMKQKAKYQAIAEFYEVHQQTTGDSIAFSIVNTHKAAGYLIGGTTPHTITQAPHVIPRGKLASWLSKRGENPRFAGRVQYFLNQRPIIIEHPGNPPDTEVQAIADEVERETLSAVVDGQMKWAQRFGAPE